MGGSVTPMYVPLGGSEGGAWLVIATIMLERNDIFLGFQFFDY